jgi:hypothetical protein
MNTNLYQNFSFVLFLPECNKSVFCYEICPSGSETLLILFLYLFLFCSHIAALLFFTAPWCYVQLFWSCSHMGEEPCKWTRWHHHNRKRLCGLLPTYCLNFWLSSGVTEWLIGLMTSGWIAESVLNLLLHWIVMALAMLYWVTDLHGSVTVPWLLKTVSSNVLWQWLCLDCLKPSVVTSCDSDCLDCLKPSVVTSCDSDCALIA